MTEEKSRNKIAVVDLLLAYPPRGGAGVDLFNNFKRLSASFDIKLFGLSVGASSSNAAHDFERGIIDEEPPLDCSLIPVDKDAPREIIVENLLKQVSEWNPDLVYIADGWTLKPYVIKAFYKRFKTVVRLYAYEMLCPRNNQRWLFDHRCFNNALEDCDKCLECAAEYREIVRKHRDGADNPLTHEASLADIWKGDYSDTLLDIVKNCHFIVYNSMTADILKKHGCLSAAKIPGAVSLEDFIFTEHKNKHDRKFEILVFGRMDDRAKGADTAVKAGVRLWRSGLNINMKITCSTKYDYPWLHEIGWKSQEEIIELMKEADCVFVPSLWDEAFGMTWVEAMASGVPVVASRLAGPEEYIKDRENGLLAEPGNPEDFAEKAMLLYCDEDLYRKLVRNGRKVVEENFNWDVTAEKTAALIKQIISGNEPR